MGDTKSNLSDMTIGNPNRGRLKYILFVGALLLFAITSCNVLPPRRQYIKEAKQQKVPVEILNTSWILYSFDNNVPDCSLVISFLEKGQFTLRFKDELYQGDHLWYIVTGSVIEFHTSPLEKLAWTTDNCTMNPPRFALYIQGDKQVTIENDTLTFLSFDSKEFVFRKI